MAIGPEDDPGTEPGIDYTERYELDEGTPADEQNINNQVADTGALISDVIDLDSGEDPVLPMGDVGGDTFSNDWGSSEID